MAPRVHGTITTRWADMGVSLSYDVLLVVGSEKQQEQPVITGRAQKATGTNCPDVGREAFLSFCSFGSA